MVLLYALLLACAIGPEKDSIFGRGGRAQWIDVGAAKLKTEIYSSTHLSARPLLVIVLHGDLSTRRPATNTPLHKH